jgi:adenylate cyclase
MRHDHKSTFMSRSGKVAVARDAPLFAWLGPLAGFAEMGTAGYPRAVRRRLTIVNVMAFLIAIFSAVYACGVGIAGGPVMAGVIGADKFSYDVWGKTVNLASRLESHGLPGEIQVSDAVREALGDSFVFEPRGAIEVKGVGQLETWLLKEERGGRAWREGAASA